MAKQRDLRLDLIRSAAVVMVLSVHFFLNCGFYDLPVQGHRMEIAAIVRTGLMSCVPLFLLLSGWLLGERRWSLRYYKGALRVIVAYGLAGTACFLFRGLFLHGPLRPGTWLRELLQFSAAPYGWYIAMYLGLFLLIPFLNAMWAALGQRERKFLIATLLLVAVAPSIDNITAIWQIQLLPDWWNRLYPIAYYCIGMQLRQCPIPWRWPVCLLGAAVSTVCGGLVHIYLMKGGPLAYLEVTYWGGLFTVTTAVLLFSALRQWPAERWPGGVRWCLDRLSRLSLSVYLISWIPDQLVYPRLAARVPEIVDRLVWFPVVVVTVLLLSLPMAQVLVWLEGGILRLADRLWPPERAAVTAGGAPGPSAAPAERRGER